eukprot:TRINITY_DN5251_c0_g1_i1.p1 TRINITY_DN5251_c0_g1~~TRINITY_DN5251_c0_g1_i1.p1  ORF type:complete len:50 (+),score=14.75 TRINITY_DN5251_c0_g1_i1:371-520(+)
MQEDEDTVVDTGGQLNVSQPKANEEEKKISSWAGECFSTKSQRRRKKNQ